MDLSGGIPCTIASATMKASLLLHTRLVGAGAAVVAGGVMTVNIGGAQSEEAISKAHPRVLVATYPANNPTEDRSVHQSGPGGWQAAAVFDGHGGWQVAELAHRTMLQHVAAAYAARAHAGGLLSYLYTDPALDCIVHMEQDLLGAFRSVEKTFKDKVSAAFALGFGPLAKVGCCALVCLQRGDRLVLANLGDCRAVLGSSLALAPSSSSPPSSSFSTAAQFKYLATRLTHDHNARVALEALQLRRRHPNETDIIRCKSPTACYVKGRLQLTSALGDLYLKYPEFNAPASSHRSGGRHIPPPYTPPYVNSVPEVTTVRLQRGGGDACTDRFVILATDGLWDELTDQEAVSIVGQCVQAGAPQEAADQLVAAALAHAAADCRMTLDELRALPPGDQRRGRHDDTTAVVLYLD